MADWQGRFLARGYLNRRSQITVRLLTWDEGQRIGRCFLRCRLERAIEARRALADDPATDAYRLVNAESDLLPGLIVDRYGGYLVVQFLTLGIERWKGELVGLLAMRIIAPGGILFTFSCSGLVSPDLFQKVVFGASVDAGRDVQIIEKLSQASDHPILLSFPESGYLKGLVCRVL